MGVEWAERVKKRSPEDMDAGCRDVPAHQGIIPAAYSTIG
jgi:hypothetical protein